MKTTDYVPLPSTGKISAEETVYLNEIFSGYGAGLHKDKPKIDVIVRSPDPLHLELLDLQISDQPSAYETPAL